MSWHISCLITNPYSTMPCSSTDQLDLNAYVHILENGNQGWFSVAHIIHHLLAVLKRVISRFGGNISEVRQCWLLPLCSLSKSKSINYKKSTKEENTDIEI